LLLPPSYRRSADFAVIFVCYIAAKLFESADRMIFSTGHVVSGHTLKHFAPAAAGYWILGTLQRREPCPQEFIAG
jgi:hypothetical protein